MESVLLGLPFIHHEQLDDQTYALKGALTCWISHRELIRFGRFQHRNAVLGRSSTPEESAFLGEHGRGF